ncbi:hypothetical protein ACLMJK_003619 [Lecanora helva]
MLDFWKRRICCVLAVFVGYNVIARAADTKFPAAISVPVKTKWYGNDGAWSPVSLRLGTSPQWVDLFVSTAGQETLVVGPAGCDSSDAQCVSARGGLFKPDESSSWIDQGAYRVSLDLELGFDGNGIYGLDSIAIDDQISVPSQTIGIVNSTEYFLGYFGLGIQHTRVTSKDQFSFIDSMVENKSFIPSHSYGYTAGAHYRLKSIPSSLTLGGYDTKRFVPHDVSYDLSDSLQPVLALNEISVTSHPSQGSSATSGWVNNSVTLLGSGEADLFTIDSTTPYLWLPEAVCSNFEKAFGLVYDESVQLYTFGTNSTQHKTLVDWNMTFQFTLADLPGSSKIVSLSLPYAAFDLQLSYPYPGLNATVSSPPVNYFPLRKAANNTQYTIGRSFLQETYIIVDYERSNFSIHQALFSQDALTDRDLVDITWPKNSTLSGPRISKTSKLGKAEIAGVVVGAAIAVVLMIVMGVLCFRLQRDRMNKRYIKDRSDERSRKTRSSNSRFVRWLFRLPSPDAPTEIGGAAVWTFEAPNDKGVTELPEKSSHSELEGSTTDVPAYQEADRKRHGGNAICAIGHDPEKPVELPYRSSARGFFEPESAPKVQFAPPALIPPRESQHYRLSRHGTQTTAGISSPSDSPSKRSSKASSPTYMVSPITPGGISPEYSSLTGMARREAWYVANDEQFRDQIGQIPRRPTPAVSLLSESIHSANSTASNNTRKVHKQRSRSLKHQPSVSLLSESGESECSNGSTVTNKIRKSISRGFSWDPDSFTPQAGPSSPPPMPSADFNPPSRWHGIRPSGHK